MIDTHFHLIRPAHSAAYQNKRKLSIDREWERCGIVGGIAVQPSMYRFDNSHLLSILNRFPEKLRGVAVVPQDVKIAQLEDLKRLGIIGLRLNMIDNPEQRSVPGPDFFKKTRDANLFLQVHAKGIQLANVIDASIRYETSLVVDHIGKPDSSLGTDQSGFREMIGGAQEGSVMIKLSAPFRIADKDAQFETASCFARCALDQAPLDRFLLGTDWPFLNCAKQPSMDCIQVWFKKLLPRNSDFTKVAFDNASRLSGLIPNSRSPDIGNS